MARGLSVLDCPGSSGKRDLAFHVRLPAICQDVCYRRACPTPLGSAEDLDRTRAFLCLALCPEPNHYAPLQRVLS